MHRFTKLCLLTTTALFTFGQARGGMAAASADARLPGKGLAQHPFLYCGEWQNQSLDQQTMYLVKKGKIVWTYTNPKRGELGDCTRMSNGNIVFSRQYGASEITPDKTIVWNYDAHRTRKFTPPTRWARRTC